MKILKLAGACKAGGRRRMFLPLSLITAAVLFSCGQAKYEQTDEKSIANQIADSVSAYVPGITSDTIKGSAFHFLRKGHIECEVKDVLNVTQAMESEVLRLGGYIEKSELLTVKDYTSSIQFKKDSVLEITHYTAASHITARVPNHELDTFMRTLSSHAVFVDLRKIAAEDVKLKLYSNSLAEKRYTNHNARLLAAKKDSQKLQTQINAEESVLEKQSLADNKRLESLQLADDVNYSDVTVVFYEKQKSKSEVLASSPSPQAYTPSFAERLGESFIGGLNILKQFLLFIVNIWGLLVIALCLYFAVRKIIHYHARNEAKTKHT